MDAPYHRSDHNQYRVRHASDSTSSRSEASFLPPPYQSSAYTSSSDAPEMTGGRNPLEQDQLKYRFEAMKLPPVSALIQEVDSRIIPQYQRWNPSYPLDEYEPHSLPLFHETFASIFVPTTLRYPTGELPIFDTLRASDEPQSLTQTKAIQRIADWQRHIPVSPDRPYSPTHTHELKAPTDALDAWHHSRSQICVPQEVYYGPMSNGGRCVEFEPSWSNSRGAPMCELLLPEEEECTSPMEGPDGQMGRFHIPRRCSIQDPDDEVLSDLVCPVISFGIYWPGHVPWVKTITIRDPDGLRISRLELVTAVAQEYRAFFDEKINEAMISPEGEWWDVAKDVDRLRIVKVCNPDGDANWHAELAYICD